MALLQSLHFSMKVERDSVGLMPSYSMFNDMSTSAPKLGVIQDKTLSRIGKPQTLVQGSVAVLG